MPYCMDCGAEAPEGAEYCIHCGGEVREERPHSAPEKELARPPVHREPMPRRSAPTAGSRPAPRASDAYARPSRREVPAAAPSDRAASRPVKREALSVGGYLGSLILMCLPVIGLVITIVWACGGTSQPSRKNLARAFLLFSVIALVVAVLAGILVAGLIDYYFGDLIREFGNLYGALGGAQGAGSIIDLVGSLSP